MIIVQKTDYNRKNITAGIAHIGVGNFHRAHQAYYTHMLLSDETQQNWGICGIALLPSDGKLVAALKEQDYEYTLLACGRNGVDEASQVSSIIDIIWSEESKEAVIAKLAEPNIKIISMTITEGGYNLDKATGNFILDNEAIQHDLKNLSTPNTVFGYIAAALRLRMENGAGAVTILSCDNLQHNGNTAKKAFTSFIEAQDEKLALWVKENVTFPNSMVDRITPVVTPADREKINKATGVEDLAPIYCEDFIQWVIEDNFAAGRPTWENVGVEFTDDVTAYENMKLSLLNASHSLLSYPSFLAGYRKVDDAMHDDIIVKYVRQFMDIDITPYVPAPGNIDLELYKKTLVERFGNRSVSDQIARLCFDGVSKLPVYIMPNLAKMLADGADVKRVAFFVAAYARYLMVKIDDKSEKFFIDEPQLTAEDAEILESKDTMTFLKLSPFSSVDLASYENFVELYNDFYNKIGVKGVLDVLATIL